MSDSDPKSLSPTKGIVDFANKFTLFGFHAFYIGILIQCVRERRVRELLATGLRMFWYWVKPVPTPKSITNLTRYLEIHERFSLHQDTPLIARRQAVWRDGDMMIAGEYGKPGARLLVIVNSEQVIYRPYQKSVGVQHIHAIARLEGPYFLVSTGDTSKRLDLFKITGKECTLLSCISPSLAGFTAISVVENEIWVGSDFSERANFISKMSAHTYAETTYYLPKNCVREFVISISPYDENRLLVVTARLNQTYGHALIFCRIDHEFIAANKIQIDEEIENAAI